MNSEPAPRRPGRRRRPVPRAGTRGQALVFAVVTFAVLAYFGVMIVNVSARAARQVRMQNAADEAALAAAWAEADGLAQIAWLNEAMAEIHYHRMRLAADNATLGTLAALKAIGPDWRAEASVTPPDSVVGLSGAVGRWEAIYADAEAFLPEAEIWFERLSELQQGIAGVLPYLVKQEARFRAERNGAHRTLVYPAHVHVPRAPLRYRIAFTRLAGTEEADLRWTAVSSGLGLDILGERTLSGADREAWRFRLSGYGVTMAHELRVPYGEAIGERMRITVDVPGESARTYTLRMVGDPGAEGMVMAWAGGGANLSMRTGADEAGELYFEIDSGARRLRLRYDGQGRLVRWRDRDGDGLVEEDEWQLVQDEAITVAGVEIPTRRMQDIRISEEVSLRLPIHPGGRPEVTARDFHVLLGRPLRFYVRTPAGPISFSEGEARHQGLGTASADGRWRRLGSVRLHRMLPLGSGTWEYETYRPPAKLDWMDRRVFATHALMDHDPFYDPGRSGGAGAGAVYPGTEAWAVPTREGDWPALASDDARYAEDGGGRWARFPFWAQPHRTGSGESPDEGGFGGFFDPETGGPRDDTHHHQTRVCWFCSGQGRAGALRNYDPVLYWRDPELSEALYLRRLPRPCGFWHEYPDSIDVRRRELEGRGARVTVFTVPGGTRQGLQVRCPLECRHAFDSVPRTYAGSGVTRVRVDLSDVEALVARRHGRFADTYLRIPWSETHRPLAATGELFRHATVVAVWAPGGEAVQWGWERSHGRGGAVAEGEGAEPAEAEAVGFPGPGWGHYALAAARIAVRDPDAPEADRYVAHLPRDPSEDALFRAGGLEPEDPLGRPLSWRRTLWIRSGMNLFEPAWVAALTPLDAAADVDDFYLGTDPGTEITDSGAALIMRLLRDQWSAWDAAPEAEAVTDRAGGSDFDPRLDGMDAPDRSGRTLDWDDPALSEVLLH